MSEDNAERKRVEQIRAMLKARYKDGDAFFITEISTFLQQQSPNNLTMQEWESLVSHYAEAAKTKTEGFNVDNFIDFIWSPVSAEADLSCEIRADELYHSAKAITNMSKANIEKFLNSLSPEEKQASKAFCESLAKFQEKKSCISNVFQQVQLGFPGPQSNL